MSALDQAPQRASAPALWGEWLASALRRLALGSIAGLVLACIVHIVTILLIPVLSERDATSAYLALGAAGHAQLISGRRAEPGLPELRDADPFTATAACGYDLGNGPVRVVARAGSLPLGLTVQRKGGGVLYAITDRAAIRGVLEFVVMTDAQQDERIARDDENEAVRELRVVSDTQQGLIVARVLSKRPSDRADAEALAAGVACGLAD